MGHIPPGVDLVATARKLTNICAGGQLQMFLSSERLAEVIEGSSDTISLALFGHTHADEMRLLANSGATQPAGGAGPGVPLKSVASISPVNGNHSTFTIARVDPTTATLDDYTVFEASNFTGIATTWSAEYTYSTAYHQPAFNAAAVSTLVSGFQTDTSASSPASQAYLRNYFPGTPDLGLVLQAFWPQYACSLDHDSAADFTACACSTAK
jgi:sphingomyelin phosphodiesterase acid-like 3